MAGKLGGRSEVVDTPAVELFKYMDMFIEKEKDAYNEKKADMYIRYLTNVFSQPTDENTPKDFLDAKKEFLNFLTPEVEENEVIESANKGWDFDPADYPDYIENPE